MKIKLFKKNNIPNYLTIFRIVLVPIIITLLLINNFVNVYKIQLWNNNFININLLTFIAGILFIIACSSDFLDGWLARKYQWISNFGKFWDPLADKILTNSILFCMASTNQNLLPVWIPLIFIIRDIVVDGIRLYSVNKKIVLSANVYGKIKTFILMFGMIYLLFLGNSINNVGNLYYWLIQNFLIYVATFFCILSGIIYSLPLIKKK